MKFEDVDEHMKTLAGFTPGKRVISYAFGSPPPLSYAEAIEANRLEHDRALKALQTYEALLLEIAGAARLDRA